MLHLGSSSPNDSSPLSLQQPAFFPGNATLTWSSVTNRSYAVERATNLGTSPAFSPLCTSIPGQPGTTSWTNTNAAGSAPRFCRVRVEH